MKNANIFYRVLRVRSRKMKNEQNTVEEYLLKDADIFSGVLRGRTRNMYIEILRRNQQNSKSAHKIPANVQIFL